MNPDTRMDLRGEADPARSSRLPGFYELPMRERRAVVASYAGLDAAEVSKLAALGSITPELVDVFIENAVGVFALPLGIATNFLINGRDILVPMAVEETSVLAAFRICNIREAKGQAGALPPSALTKGTG